MPGSLLMEPLPALPLADAIVRFVAGDGVGVGGTPSTHLSRISAEAAAEELNFPENFPKDSLDKQP